MIHTLLLTVILLGETEAPSVENFAGMRYAVPGPISGPREIGDSRAWEGSHVSIVNPKHKQIVSTYFVVQTDIGKLSPRPDPGQILALHERNSRNNKKVAALSLRRSYSRIGRTRMVILTGTCIAPGDGGAPVSGFWLSFCFPQGTRVYEFSQVSLYFPEYCKSLEAIAKMTFRPKESGPEMTVSGIPDAEEGTYAMAGVPFVISTPVMLVPATTSTRDGDYADSYTAISSSLTGMSWWYKLRRLKPDEALGDTALFRKLYDGLGLIPAPPAGKPVFKQGRSRVEFDYDHSGDAWEAEITYMHDGNWVAELIGYGPKSSPEETRGVFLRPAPRGK